MTVAASEPCGLSRVTLYGYWRSSASWRVRIGLNLKGLPYAIAPISLIADGGQQHAAEYTAMSPMAQVPTLEWVEGDERVRMTQSLAILSLLDARCPHPPLFPADPLARARTLEMAEIVNAGIQPLQNLATLKAFEAAGAAEAGRAFARAAMAKGLRALERLAAEADGAFCAGDQVSVADLCLVPQLYNARRFELDLDAFPTLLAVEARCAALPAFELARPEHQPDAPRDA